MKDKATDATVSLDATAFAKMKRILPTYLAAQRDVDAFAVQDVPEEIAFKLTNQCNLRCAHCYQWNEDGHHHDLDPSEQRQHLPFSVIERAFEATSAKKSNVYLWGGEPLMYRHWNELAELLARDPRWTSVCTNGLFIEKRLESLLRISDQLELFIAVDGLEKQHDALRGAGVFARIQQGIDQLLELRRAGRYRGEVTVNCVITDDLVPHVREVVEFWEAVGVDTVYLSLLWFLSDATSAAMDHYVEQNQPFIPDLKSPGRPSWHAYKYRMSAERIGSLREQLEEIERQPWKIKVRYNPAIETEDFQEFISGGQKPAAGKTRCLSIRSRMDVLPNGDVVSCKFFPESVMGNLIEDGVAAVWHGARFGQVRETIDRCGLMPVCSKCSLLYSRGV